MAVVDEIEAVSRRRQQLWFSQELDCGTEISRLTSRLADLYETKRHERTQAATGVRRADIVRRARVESELERLMADRSR